MPLSNVHSADAGPALRSGVSNLALVEEQDAPPEVDRLYAEFRDKFGRPHIPGILKCFATHPPLLEHMLGLAHTFLFTEGALGRRNKELIATFVSAENRCAYCADSHGAALSGHGGSAELVTAALSCDLQSAALGPPKAALLNFALKVTEASHAIQPVDIEEARAAGWTDLQIAEAIHVAALFACFNRVVNAFGLPSQGLLGGLAGRPELQAEPAGSAANAHVAREVRDEG